MLASEPNPANDENNHIMETNIIRKNTKTATVLSLGLAALALGLARGDDRPGVKQLQVVEGQVIQELVGQVINATPTTSTQFGYYTFIQGLDTLFAAAPENESTALFTFYRETENLRVAVNGPLRIISRDGTTTVYWNQAAGANFANPDSFRAGTPIQTSDLRQQVIVDTLTQTFTVVNQETITSTTVFVVNGNQYRLGKVGDVLRTTKNGHLNTPGSSPTGWFAGYSVGAEGSKSRSEEQAMAETQ